MKNTENTNSTVAAANARTTVMSDTPSELGLIKIHDNVLASLVSRAVLGVEGVSRLAGSVIIDNLAGMVGSHSRAIEIIKDGEDKLKIVVKVNIFFGTVIPTAAVEIQRQVIEQVESAAGVTVAAVDVVIQQLDEEFTEEDDEEGNVDSAVLNASQAAAMSGMPTIG
ncbi:MAG: Asp23/Gls24 family envelope stress response protein [Lentisphaeria bacterium]|nr:Asp23/Gls24 family envelope stress response protein [Lentisphaerota bacterium]MBR7144981.1 Asp23/Gls24 family envelope stress response protein [Lentisphaeria bacterium]